MATCLDIVTGALKRLRVVAADETPSDVDAADTLTALNDMMTAYKLDGADTQWGDLALIDTAPVEREHIQGIKAMLAARIAEDFGKVITTRLANDADSGEELLRSDYGLDCNQKVDPLLISTTSQRRYA